MKTRRALVALAIATAGTTVGVAVVSCFPDFEVGGSGPDAEAGAMGTGDGPVTGDGPGTGDAPVGPGNGDDGGPGPGDDGSGGEASIVDQIAPGDATPLDAGPLVRIEGGTYHFQATDFDSNTDASTLVDASATITYTLGIDRYEVTVGRFRQWINANMPVPADHAALDSNYPAMTWDPTWTANAKDTSYADAAACNEAKGPTYSLGDANLPMNCVNWMQALAFCWWDGQKRLPTDTEWRIVATSEGRDLDYPWGTASPDCQHVTSSNSPFQGSQFCGFPLPVGSADAGATRDGVYDIVGSLSEWAWDFLPQTNTYAYPANAGTNYAGPASSSGRQWLGGDYTTNPYSMTAIQPGATFGNPLLGYDSNGWRCAKSLP